MKLRHLSIRTRLTAAALLLVLLAGGLLLQWSARYQRKAAVAQAQDFALSVHQMTLAGLTAMMIVGKPTQRAVFLDQIEQSNNVRALRVLRSEAVARQYGPGGASEAPLDSVEFAVLRTGTSHFEVVTTPDGKRRLRAVLPAVAARDYLGKNCLNCHAVPEGTVLGAVNMEISLDVVERVSGEYTRRAMGAALLLLGPLALLIFLAISRLVSDPLVQLTRGLRSIASSDSALDAPRLLPTGPDEVGSASDAFNQVMERFIALIRDLRLSQTAFDNAQEAIMVTDRRGVIQKVNPAFGQITGYHAREVLGKKPSILKSGDHSSEFYEQFWSALLGRGIWHGEIRNRRKDGSCYTQWLSAVAVRDAHGEATNFIGIFSDITERKRREQEITFHAFHDPLTALPNRLTLLTRLDQAVVLAQRDRHAAPSVMYIDLDGFKAVNDSYGHEAGDRLLIEVARRLTDALRASDTVARVGGDEFVVLLPETSDKPALRRVAKKLLQSLTEPICCEDVQVSISASIGIASFPEDGTDPASLVTAADHAMYSVKAKGKNSFRMASAAACVAAPLGSGAGSPMPVLHGTTE